MRALILVAGAALAVAACSRSEEANNVVNVDENLMTDMNVANDTTAVDAATNMEGNMAADANMAMNTTDNMAGNMGNMAGNETNATANNAM